MVRQRDIDADIRWKGWREGCHGRRFLGKSKQAMRSSSFFAMEGRCFWRFFGGFWVYSVHRYVRSVGIGVWLWVCRFVDGGHFD